MDRIQQLRDMIAALQASKSGTANEETKAQYQAIIDAMIQLILDLGGTYP